MNGKVNDKLMKLVTDYQQGIINKLTSGTEELPIIDMSTGKFGMTNLTIRGEQYLIYSTLRDGVEGYPKGEDIMHNIVGIKVNTFQDISYIESWLTVIKAQLASQAALLNVVPESELKEELAEGQPATVAQPST